MPLTTLSHTARSLEEIQAFHTYTLTLTHLTEVTQDGADHVWGHLSALLITYVKFCSHLTAVFFFCKSKNGHTATTIVSSKVSKRYTPSSDTVVSAAADTVTLWPCSLTKHSFVLNNLNTFSEKLNFVFFFIIND